MIFAVAHWLAINYHPKIFQPVDKLFFHYSLSAKNMTLFERVREAMATTLNVPVNTITETTSNKNFAAWDSMGHVNLMMTLEQTFDIQLEVEDFDQLNSVKAILEYLRKQDIT